MTRKNGGRVIRVLLAAASAVRRAGLETLVKNTPSLKLVGSFQSVRAIARRADELQPDVIVVDFAADGLVENDGLEAGSTSFHGVSLMAGSWPMVVLIDEPNSDWTAQVLRSGVKAILPRDATMHEILPAIQAAYAGLVLLDSEVTQSLAARIHSSFFPVVDVPEDLTPREIEVLRMLADGSGNREMAHQLGISEHTVKFHISSILDKLGAASRTEAVTMGIRMGLILL
jgi:two-component system, NarL family, response regulator YdfI